MTRAALFIACGLSLGCLTGMRQAGEPPMPAGHPPVARPPAASQPGAAATPDDVASIDGIVRAYYDSISGPAGEPRDWDRFRSLFMGDARFITVRPAADRASFVMITPQQFVEMNRSYFERGGYFEREIHRREDRFGMMAQAFSTYEARHQPGEPEPYSRGINSIQLLYDGARWWIVTVMWDFERADTNPIPEAYLPKPLTRDAE